MRRLRFGTRAVPNDRALVMAIVNRTRDSFYDRGATFDTAAVLGAVDRAVADGADIVDVGGVRAGRVVDMAASIVGTRPPARVLRALA